MIIGLAVALLLLTYSRILFGVDFTDEGFYIGVPYRFLLGDKPFVDELNFAMQLPSLVIYPFVKLYILWLGSADGIVLFLRHIYLFFTILIAFFIFLVLKRRIIWHTALFISLTGVVFIPWGIPNLSYNTLGSNFFLLGCFLALWVFSNNKKGNLMLFSGLSHGLAIISYFPLLMPVFFFAATIWLFLLFKAKKTGFVLLSYCLGVFLIFLLFLPVIINAGLYNIRLGYDYVNSMGVQGGGMEKIIGIFTGLWSNYLHKAWAMLALVAVYIGVRMKYKIFQYALLASPIAYMLLSVPQDDHIALKYISYYSLLAPYFLLFLKDNRFAKELFYIIWLPSFVAGITIAWGSSNGYINAAFGFLPASLVTSILLTLVLTQAFSRKNSPDLNKLHVIPSISVILMLLLFQYSYVYRDDKISELSTKVDFGPYKGLYTTREKSDYMNSLLEDMKVLGKTNYKVLIYDYFPGGYLFTSMRPATSTLWLRSKADKPKIDRDSTVDYYARNNFEPDIVFKIEKLFVKKNEIWDLEYPVDDSLDNFVKNRYEEVLSRDNYTVYVRK